MDDRKAADEQVREHNMKMAEIEEIRAKTAQTQADTEQIRASKVTPPTITNLTPDIMLIDGKKTPVLTGNDPEDKAHFGRVFVRTADGLQDVTGKEDVYEKPAAQTIVMTPSKQMDPELANALSRASMGLSSTKQRQVMTTVNGMSERGDPVGLIRSTIRQAALEGELAASRQQIQGRREVIEDLSAISELLKKVPTNLLVGTAENVARVLGTSTNTEYVKIGAQLALLNQSYRRSMTGAQFSIPEAQEYKGIFPDYSTTAPVNFALIDGLLSSMQRKDKLFWEGKLGPGWSDTESRRPSTDPNWPKAGTVRNGYVSNGGDPKLESTWKKQ
jgi:hypothetical protein